MTLKEIKNILHKWLIVEDDRIVDVALGCVIANLIPGESCNIYIVGPPSSGKTEIIRSLGAYRKVKEVSSLTVNSMASGWATTNKKYKPSLLNRMQDAGQVVMALKDFTSIITMRHDNRQEILGQIREVADGKYCKPFGTGEEISWNGKIGFIAGVTSIIDEFYSTNQVLGERFLFYRIENHIHPLLIAEHAQKMAGREGEMRTEIEGAFAAFLDSFTDLEHKSLDISKEMLLKIRNIVCFVAGFRSGVSRNRYTRTYDYLPQVEAPPRLSKQMTQLGAGIALAQGKREVDEEVFSVIRKVGWDTIPALRRKIISALRTKNEPMKTGYLAVTSQLNERTVREHLDDLMVLGVISKSEDDHGAIQWKMQSMYKEFLDGIGEDNNHKIVYQDEIVYEEA